MEGGTRIIMKLTAIAREDLEAKGLILKNKIELKCRGTANGMQSKTIK